jgi:hypothetical protein
MSTFTFESFTVRDKAITLLHMIERDEYLVPYKQFRSVLGLTNRTDGKPADKRPKNRVTPEILKRVREHNDVTICKPSTVRLLIMSLQDVVNLHWDSDVVVELAETSRGEERKKNYPSPPPPPLAMDREESPPPPRKRARDQVVEFEDVVRKLLHDKYKQEYVDAHAAQWRQEYLEQAAEQNKEKMRKLEMFLEEMKK